MILVMTVMGLRIEPMIQNTEMCVCKVVDHTTYRCVVEETTQTKVKLVSVLDDRNLPAEAKVKVLCSKDEVDSEEVELD